MLRRFRNGLYKKHLSVDETLAQLPESARTAFRNEVVFHSLHLHSRHDSQRDGASKLIFRTERGHLIESVVLRIGSGRTSLCISSQVGCAAKCAFCATGRMGIAVSLTRDEILDQVFQVNRLLKPEGRSVRNVVFMGMGEPFHNEENVHAALDVLLSAQCFDLTASRVMVSTVGIPDALMRCAEHYPRLGLALSLHAARQERRERIIPLARKYPLEELRQAMQAVASARQPLMVEYLLLHDLNDTEEDLEALVEFLRDIPVHVNLIPYNSIDEAPDLQRALPERQQRFSATLSAAGFPVTVRYSLGADIAAACGQLVRQENRRGLQLIDG